MTTPQSARAFIFVFFFYNGDSILIMIFVRISIEYTQVHQHCAFGCIPLAMVFSTCFFSLIFLSLKHSVADVTFGTKTINLSNYVWALIRKLQSGFRSRRQDSHVYIHTNSKNYKLNVQFCSVRYSRKNKTYAMRS